MTEWKQGCEGAGVMSFQWRGRKEVVCTLSISTFSRFERSLVANTQAQVCQNRYRLFPVLPVVKPNVCAQSLDQRKIWL